MSTDARIKVRCDTLTFNDGTKVTFQRTLRIPDNDKRYPLPPGLGTFPLRRVDDYADRVPEEWRERGGVFLPMFQREAMWICFSTPSHKPRAVKVAVGKVCALTGERWSEGLHRSPQDYLVTPPQPWLDGICAGKGTIRQFVAMPLGMGYTVEGQVTGEEKFGGIQIKVFEPQPGRFRDKPRWFDAPWSDGSWSEASECCESDAPVQLSGMMKCSLGAPAPQTASAELCRSRAGAMGLGAGGRMKQKVYPDPHGIATWDPTNTSRLFVHIVNSELWREITGEAPPVSPVTAKSYAAHGLPWFDLYDENAPTLDPTHTLAQVKSVKVMDQHTFNAVLQDDDPVPVGPVKKLYTKLASALGVRDGEW